MIYATYLSYMTTRFSPLDKEQASQIRIRIKQGDLRVSKTPVFDIMKMEYWKRILSTVPCTCYQGITEVSRYP